MNVTTKVKMDLSAPDFCLSVNAVQGDAYTRSIRIALYNGISPWIIPEDITVAIRYAKPDGSKGYYDAMPDGTSAWSKQENVLTVLLAPQMLSVAGNVKAQIELIRETHILSTFTLTVYVESNPAAGVLKSEDYINWLQWIRTQSEVYAQSVQNSADEAEIAAQKAHIHTQTAAGAAQLSQTAAQEATASAASAETARARAAALVENFVSTNTSYSKKECDLKYGPAIIPTATGTSVSVSDSTDAPFAALSVYGKTTQNTVPSQANPAALVNIGQSGTVTVTTTGKNIMYPNTIGTNSTSGFVTELLSDGSVKVNGINANYGGYCHISKMVLSPGTYMLTGCPSGGSASTYALSCQKSSGSFVGYDLGNGLKITVVQEESYDFLARIARGYQANDLIYYPQLELGTAATAFEPYHCRGSLNLETPNGLSGIPVSSGGNYSDQNGQQWICDEIDCSKGVMIRRIGRISNYQGEAVSSPWMSSTGKLSTGAEILYILDTPLETPLPDQNLEIYSVLRTAYPYTYLTNDAAAHMKLKYVADTKLYIDQLLKKS